MVGGFRFLEVGDAGAEFLFRGGAGGGGVVGEGAEGEGFEVRVGEGGVVVGFWVGDGGFGDLWFFVGGFGGFGVGGAHCGGMAAVSWVGSSRVFWMSGWECRGLALMNGER